jgi:putative N6-adenine-specific DNA methylase
MPVSRGGLKLEAAIRHFGLSNRIRGARAIDVGASTGGFTESLLAHSAAHVVAVDVGHGQLHPKLKNDPRVESLEGAHWKTLSLNVAPGPFDFFSVDVSFMAARNVLRGLAFRLRAGAEGIVLIKPQFELPEGSDVTNPELRKRAVERVREKAEELGFEIAGVIDSPVAGGEGTVEMLAHLRFRGRSAKLPQPGERRRKEAPRVEAVPGELRMFVVAAPGLEPVAEREVRELAGAREVRHVPGGVEFAGTPETLYRANLWLRTATRVLVRIGEVEAREFARLRRGVEKLPWKRFFASGAPLEFHVSQSGSRLYHTGAVAENLELALRDAAGKQVGGNIYARGERDRWTLSVDSSGELLHKRGWRLDATEAPLRETLAAGLLHLCEWDPSTPLVDPMCGSGTIALEACAWAMRRAPGVARDFAFFRFASFDTALWQRLLEEARTNERPPPAPIVASDRDARAVKATGENAARGGFAITVTQSVLSEVVPPAQPGLVLINPPYGRRLGDPRALRRQAVDIGRWLRSRCLGWRAGVLVPVRAPADAFGVPVKASYDLRNGGLRVRLLHLEVP